MKRRHAQLMEAIDGLGKYAEDLCRALVRTNTVNRYAGGVTGNETDGQKIFGRELDRLGFDTRFFEPPPDVYAKAGVLGPGNRSFAGRNNLVGVRSFGNGAAKGKTVVWNGHMDTVGIQGMTVDPFGAECRGGRIYGRGASDNKGGLAGGAVAAKALVDGGFLDRGKIIFESVIEEECSGSGAGTIACCLEGYKGDYAIVLDGGIDKISVECMGVVTGYVTVAGEGGHAAYRGRVSALDMAVLVKERLDVLKKERLAGHELTSFCIGEFAAGEAPWMVPRSARIGFNMSYPVEEALRGEAEHGLFNGIICRRAVERALRECSEKHPWLRRHPPAVEWMKDLPPYRTDRASPVVAAMERACRLVKLDAAAGIESGWGDASWLTRLGGMQTAAIGAGEPGSAHSADESVSVGNILAQAKVVALATMALMEA
ncbi:MAG: M20 family metallopeptidase [Lentisphaerae bacterium]|nr:M20 family metallopeptidase [Lentisphaerota bacterium]